MQARFFPWLDRSGHLSTLKLAVFAALFAPAVWIAAQYDLGWLKSDTVKSVIHESGLWAVRILLVSLAISPLRRIGRWNKLVAVRRMLGVAVLFYVLGHFTLYIVQQRGDLVHVASEIALRFYLTVGFVALLGLAILGATSTDAMIRRIGPARWNRLHMLAYPIGVLALLHYMLQTKLDVSRPMLLIGLFLWLMGWRSLNRFKRGDSVPALVALALVVPVLTALFEAGWYHVRNGIEVADVLSADFDFGDGFRPVWLVLIAAIVVVALRVARPLWTRRLQPERRLRAAAE